MDIQATKLAFIEKFLRLTDESLIKKLDETLEITTKRSGSKSLEDFAGILNNKDAETFTKAALSSRQIDINEW